MIAVVERSPTRDRSAGTTAATGSAATSSCSSSRPSAPGAALDLAGRLHAAVAARRTASVTVGVAESTVTGSKDTLVPGRVRRPRLAGLPHDVGKIVPLDVELDELGARRNARGQRDESARAVGFEHVLKFPRSPADT
jgi:hypothetical protein